jgi:hypothetical protein
MELIYFFFGLFIFLNADFLAAIRFFSKKFSPKDCGNNEKKSSKSHP